MKHKRMMTFYLLLIYAHTQTMEVHSRADLFCHAELLSQVTERLCLNYTRDNIDVLRKDIASLKQTNKFLENYYAQEKNAQKIIRFCSNNLDSNDLFVAEELGFHEIKKKLAYFFSFPNKEVGLFGKESLFTSNDLKDPWYLNSTAYIDRSLLYRAINFLDLTKAQQIIDYSPVLEFRYDGNQNILYMIIKVYQQFKSCKYYPGKLLQITECLMKKGLLVSTQNGLNPLMRASYYGCKDIARLLLKYGADPYAKDETKEYNAFDLENGDLIYQNKLFGLDRVVEKGWLKDMVDEVALYKK